MKKKLLVIVVASIGLCVLVLLVGKIFAITSVECMGEKPCSPEIAQLLESKKGKNYIQAKKELTNDLAKQPKVKSYKLKFKFPSTLSVEVYEKVGVVALKFAEDRYFIFDENSTLLDESPQNQLPFATVLGLPSQKELLFGVKLLNTLATYYGIGEAKIDTNGLHVVLPGKGDVSFPLAGDVDVILGSLEVVLLQLNRTTQNHTIISEAGNDIRIDLRYKNPVVFGI